MAKRSKVICTTVGPYAKYGTYLVEACVETKTNYCDISLSYAFKSNIVVINSAIDNLLKGAASQAIQCLDIMID